MKLGLRSLSAEWYETTAWNICADANNQPKAIKAGYETYELALRDSQQRKLKKAIETQYKYNLTFKGGK